MRCPQASSWRQKIQHSTVDSRRLWTKGAPDIFGGTSVSNGIFEIWFLEWKGKRERVEQTSLLPIVMAEFPICHLRKHKWNQCHRGRMFKMSRNLHFLSTKQTDRCIWGDCVPPKLSFLAWETTLVKFLTLEQHQRRGFFLAIGVFYAMLIKKKHTTFFFTVLHCLLSFSHPLGKPSFGVGYLIGVERIFY